MTKGGIDDDVARGRQGVAVRPWHDERHNADRVTLHLADFAPICWSGKLKTSAEKAISGRA
jgi:hypothetical protein